MKFPKNSMGYLGKLAQVGLTAMQVKEFAMQSELVGAVLLPSSSSMQLPTHVGIILCLFRPRIERLLGA